MAGHKLNVCPGYFHDESATHVLAALPDEYQEWAILDAKTPDFIESLYSVGFTPFVFDYLRDDDPHANEREMMTQQVQKEIWAA
eukprot:4664566-Karenia_brevis.AAC.1